MKTGFNIILDGQFGSCGKGKFAAWLASENRLGLQAVVGNNGPNAGHTTLYTDEIRADGAPLETHRIVLKQLPSSSIFCKNVFIGPGAVIDEARLEQECQELQVNPKVSSRAALLQPHYVEREIECMKPIASTASGTGAAISAKVMRREKAVYSYAGNSGRELSNIVWSEALRHEAKNGMVLCEVSQGHWLSLDHGLSYPYCTSRNCAAQAAQDQCGIPAKMVADVYLLLRSYPIRVGNGEGYSGPFHSDSVEIGWNQIAAWGQMPEEERGALITREHTTVTKRLRRVSTFSYEAARIAAAHNGATRILLNFAQYLDWRAHGVRDWDNLPAKVRAWVDAVEASCNVPVFAVGTGEHIDDVAVNPNA